MRLLIALLLIASAASAMTLKEFESHPSNERPTIIADCIDKMTTDLAQSNPQLAKDIRAWFARKAAGKPVSEGAERLYVELMAIENRAEQGRADLDKIKLESVIVYVVKQKFLNAKK